MYIKHISYSRDNTIWHKRKVYSKSYLVNKKKKVFHFVFFFSFLIGDIIFTSSNGKSIMLSNSSLMKSGRRQKRSGMTSSSSATSSNSNNTSQNVERERETKDKEVQDGRKQLNLDTGLLIELFLFGRRTEELNEYSIQTIYPPKLIRYHSHVWKTKKLPQFFIFIIFHLQHPVD